MVEITSTSYTHFLRIYGTPRGTRRVVNACLGRVFSFVFTLRKVGSPSLPPSCYWKSFRVFAGKIDSPPPPLPRPWKIFRIVFAVKEPRAGSNRKICAPSPSEIPPYCSAELNAVFHGSITIEVETMRGSNSLLARDIFFSRKRKEKKKRRGKIEKGAAENCSRRVWKLYASYFRAFSIVFVFCFFFFKYWINLFRYSVICNLRWWEIYSSSRWIDWILFRYSIDKKLYLLLTNTVESYQRIEMILMFESLWNNHPFHHPRLVYQFETSWCSFPFSTARNSLDTLTWPRPWFPHHTRQIRNLDRRKLQHFVMADSLWLSSHKNRM